LDELFQSLSDNSDTDDDLPRLEDIFLSKSSSKVFNLDKDLVSNLTNQNTNLFFKNIPSNKKKSTEDLIKSELESNSDSDESVQLRGFPGVKCYPAKFEFTNVFPGYPKSHKNGYATIIKLDEGILN